MNSIQNIKLKDYSYNLPDEKIAKYPLDKRDMSKLLIYNKGQISDDKFYNVDNYIEKDSLLIFNNTKVIQARIKFKKPTGADIEIFCLEPYEPSDYQLAFNQIVSCKWICLIGNLKKWKNNELLKEIEINNEKIQLVVKKIDQIGKNYILEFLWNKDKFTFGEILQESGLTPIPPYLNRNSELIDKERYQTIYSKKNGSVAAPTAGLHFTKSVFTKLKNKNVKIEELTLHVGAGTFRPVQSETVIEHEMHTEHIIINKALIENLIKYSDKIISVGTTSLRALESIYWIGVKILNNNYKFHITQWEPYNQKQKTGVEQSLQAILQYMSNNNLSHIQASTQIIIVPGYEFKVINSLITNYHQPKSTLLLLVAALIGEEWRKVYNYSLDNNFRFLSYGDSSILIP